MQWAVRLGLLAVLGTVAILTAGWVGVAGAAAETVELCHLPGTPDEQTLMVPQSAVGAHLDHGDVLGSCEDAPAPPVLPEVLTRGTLRCGVSGFVPGFSEVDAEDAWSGLDVDLCRVVAAAVLGDADAVEFVQLAAADRFAAVREGTVDVLFRTTTDTLTRDATLANGGQGVDFGPTYFYDGVTALANADTLGDCAATGDCGLPDLDREDVTICALAGTTAAETLAQLELAAETVLHPNLDDIITAADSGDCGAIWFDQVALIGIQQLLASPGDFVIFADTFSKEPLASAVRDGDDEWAAVVRWAVYATFLAEELDLDSANIAARRNKNAQASRAFGDDAGVTGAALGLDADWGFDAISQVGNYAEIYERNLTAPYGLARGRNASYLDGGLLYASLIR